MPITDQTALVNITSAKEQKITFQPLILCEITFKDAASTVLRLASENLDSTENGPQYQGHDWKPRISEQSLAAVASTSDNGILLAPQINLSLIDADKFILTTYENPIGFKGAKIVLKFVFWDPDTNNFSEDELVKFVGICNAPSKIDYTHFRLSATNIINLADVNLPPAPISRRCGWIFPSNEAERLLAATDPDSDFYECGYSADINHTAARGNAGPTDGVFTSCGYTWEDCVARLGDSALDDHSNSLSTPVQIEQDQSGRSTGRFGGIHYDPPSDWRGRAYTSGSKDEGVNQTNEGKFQDYFPMIFGEAFVEPPVMQVLGDPNSTRFEVVLTIGEVHDDVNTEGPIEAVIVNDFLVPFRNSSPDKTILGWSWVNTGDRDGKTNRDAIWDGRGDPYGSIAAIAIVVPRKIQDSNSLPRTRVLLKGPKVRVFNSPDPQDYTRQFTTNSAWNLLELLTWCGLKIGTDVDIQSFIDAAAVCEPLVTYTDLTGREASHPRYQLGLSLRERRNAGDVIKAVLAGMKGMLSPHSGLGSAAGKLRLIIKQTLGSQQGSPIAGSNDEEAVASADASESFQSGYSAYHFDESNILRRGPERNSPSSFEVEFRPNQDTPNRLTINFQDEDYYFSPDQLSVVDGQDVGRSGKETPGGTAAEGLVNFDQGRRIIQTLFAESFRGNPRGGSIDNDENQIPDNDTGGTWIVTFDASFRAIHLAVGQLIRVSQTDYELSGQLFRIISLAPSTNCERITVRAAWHEDDWYLDRYGQRPDPLLQARRRHRLMRPPFGWLPNYEAPLADDPMIDPTEKTFALAELYEAAADGTAIAKIRVTGREIVNDFSAKTSPPFATDAETGSGDIPAGTYYLALCGEDEDGKLTPPSYPLVKVTLASTGSITLPNLYWQEGTVAWRLYASRNPNKLSLQALDEGTPDSVTISEYLAANQAMPDVQYDHKEIRVKKVWHSGVFGATVADIPEPNQLTLSADPGGDWSGRVLSVLGRSNNSEDLPIWNFLVDSNDGATFTFVDVDDFEELGVKVGDAVVARTQPDVFSATTVGDSKFVNDVDYFDPPIAITGAIDSPIVLTLATPHNYLSGDEVFVSGVLGNFGANGVFGITVPATEDENYNKTHIILEASTSDGDYAGGGFVTLVTNGMRVDAEIGREVIIIAGTGRGQRRKIVSNDQTTLTIDGEWATIPDETSVFIIVESNWLQSLPTGSTHNSGPDSLSTYVLPVDNYLNQVLLVQVFTLSSDKRESIETDSPMREIYVFGGPGDSSANFDKATFNIDVNEDLIEEVDVAPHYIVRLPGRISAEFFTGFPASCEAKLKEACGGGSVIADVILTKADASFSGSIFNQHDGEGDTGIPSKIVITAGSTDIVVQNDFRPDLQFDENDILTVNVDSVPATPGRTMTIVLKWTVD